MRRYESMSDDQLVHLYSAGTNEAFDTLLLRYDAYVHTTIRYWVTDEDLVEDIFQDTFIKVMMTIRQGRYTAEGKFRSWIGRIAHNLIMDHFRRQRTRGQEQTIEGTSTEDLLQTIQIPAPDAIAEERLIHGEYVDELGYGLSQLSAEQQEVVRLRYWEEKSFKEIAEETGVSINTPRAYALRSAASAPLRASVSLPPPCAVGRYHINIYVPSQPYTCLCAPALRPWPRLAVGARGSRRASALSRSTPLLYWLPPRASLARCADHQ